jgi:hypothetical protein
MAALYTQSSSHLPIMGRSEQKSLMHENLHSPIQNDDILPLRNVTQHPHQKELSYFSSEISECTGKANRLIQRQKTRPVCNQLENLQAQLCQGRIDTIDSWKQNKITDAEAQMIIDHLFTIYLNTSHHLYKNTQWENQNHRFMFGHKTIREWS